MIYSIQGPPMCGKSFFANALRNEAIRHKQGCLLIDEDQMGEAVALLDKLAEGGVTVAMGDGEIDLAKVKWKKEPVVIVVGDHGLKRLAEIDAMAPGFMAAHGPVTMLTLEAKR